MKRIIAPIVLGFLAFIACRPAFGQSSVYQQNQVLAGPTSGSGFPSPRVLTQGDVPFAQSLGVQNATIVESHSGNAATFALKTLAGVDPTVGNPVYATFPNGSQLTITAALSVTIPSTGTLGTSNGIPFRLWFALINDGGTPRIGVRNCSNTTNISGFPPTGLLSSTIITTPNSSGVTYTGVAVTSQPFLILAYASYESGQATAGTWVTSPVAPVMFGPGVPKPGDATGNSVQFSMTTASTNATTAYVDTALTATITPASAANLVYASWSGTAQISLANITCYASLRRGGSILGVPRKIFSGAANLTGDVGGDWLDAPGSSGSLVYVVSTKLDSNAGAPSCVFGNTDAGATLILGEVMG